MGISNIIDYKKYKMVLKISKISDDTIVSKRVMGVGISNDFMQVGEIGFNDLYEFLNEKSFKKDVPDKQKKFIALKTYLGKDGTFSSEYTARFGKSPNFDATNGVLLKGGVHNCLVIELKESV